MPQNCAVEKLIYWRDWQKTAVVFVPAFILLLNLTIFPFLLVLAYTGLLLLAVNFTLKLYVAVTGYFKKDKNAVDASTSSAQPECGYEKMLNTYLIGADIQISDAKVDEPAHKAVGYWNRWVQKIQDVVLVKDMFASLKSALLMWLLTYVGSVLSLNALVLLSFVAIFTLPKFYETYKAPIDKHIADVSAKYKQVESVVQQKYQQLTNRQHTKAE